MDFINGTPSSSCYSLCLLQWNEGVVKSGVARKKVQFVKKDVRASSNAHPQEDAASCLNHNDISAIKWLRHFSRAVMVGSKGGLMVPGAA